MTTTPYADAATRLADITDRELRDGVGQLFADAQRMIDRGDCTLVVLMSRRMVCLYQALVSAGMPPLTGCPVVSDRYFDSGPNRSWGDEKILILDDSVVVGTTLEHLADRLSEYISPAQITARTVCVDEQQLAPYLIEKVIGGDPLRLPTDRVRRYSEDIVKTLFRHQVPYFTDFPVADFRCPQERFDALPSNASWHVIDVSSSRVADEDHRAYTVLPAEHTDARVRECVPATLRDLVHAIKFRVYLRRVDGDAQMTIVPLALLGPAMSDRLHDTAAALAEAYPSTGSWDFDRWEAVALHRLLQTVASGVALTCVAAALGQTAVTSDTFRRSPFELYYGDAAQRILDLIDAAIADPELGKPLSPPPSGLQPMQSPLFDEPEIQETLWGSREVLSALPLPRPPAQGEVLALDETFWQVILEVFHWADVRPEARQREEIRQLGDITRYREEFGGYESRVLRHGFTSVELRASLLPQTMGGEAWDSALIMLAIDVGNDLGIVVPSTRHDRARDVLYRCYRLGETAAMLSPPLWTWPTNSEEGRAVGNAMSLDPPLKELVTIAVPGRIVQRYDGVVTSVEGDTFDATLKEPLTASTRVAKMSMAQIREQDRSRLHRGVRFAWTVFEDPTPLAMDRISRVRLVTRDPETTAAAGVD